MNINLIDGQLFDMAGKLISCMVSVFMVFTYFNTKYLHEYDTRPVYVVWEIICCVLNFIIYLFGSPVLNVCFWLICIYLTGRIFYYDENLSKGKYYIINLVFILAISVCEAIGGVLVKFGSNVLNINQNEVIISFVYTIAGSATAILMYYLLLQRLFTGKRTAQISMGQYTIYAIITVYALLNIGEILFLINHELNNEDYIFLMADAVFVIFINLYLFNLLNAFTENKNLKYKLVLYERQAKSNYDYYIKQAESYKTALTVIHDVRKHIKVLEGLKQAAATTEMHSYADAFEEMIEPLLVRQYCNNAILNIILNDKVDLCEKKGIQFDIDIRDIDIAYMEPIDVTTIFGNILDNAIEACENAQEKKITLKICPFNKFTYIQLSNTFSGELRQDINGRPVSGKGDHHGIGLENVEKVLKPYFGQITFSAKSMIFTIEILFCQPE